MLSLLAAYILTHHENVVGGSGMPDTTVEPSGGGVGLIQPKTDEGRCLLGNPNAHAFFVASCYSGSMVEQSCMLCLAVVGYRHVACCTVREGL